MSAVCHGGVKQIFIFEISKVLWVILTQRKMRSIASGLRGSIDVRPETLLTRERPVLFPKALVVFLVEAIVPLPEARDARVSVSLVIHLRSWGI